MLFRVLGEWVEWAGVRGGHVLHRDSFELYCTQNLISSDPNNNIYQLETSVSHAWLDGADSPAL